jgi:hypothetical protein
MRPVTRALAVAGTALGLAWLLIGLGGEVGERPARAQSAPALPPPASSASCQACHTGIETMHEDVTLTCTECHGGDGTQREKDRAHVLPRNRSLWKTSANPPSTYGAINLESPEFIRFVNPSDLRVAHLTCGRCHAALVEAVRRSIMAVNPMVHHAGLYNNGVEPSRVPLYGEAFAPVERDGRTTYAPARIRSLSADRAPGDVSAEDRARGVLPELVPLPRWEITIPTDPFRILEQGNVGASPRAWGTEFKISGVFLTLLKTRLNDPGLWLMGANDVGGDFRHSGCAACHVLYANDGESANAAHIARYGNRGWSFSSDPTIPKREPGHPITHQLTRRIPSSQCMTCHHHQGNGALNMFQGYLWWDQESDFDRVSQRGMGYPWWDAGRKDLGVDPPYKARAGADGTPLMGDLAAQNGEMRHVQFGEAHGHKWHFVRVYKRDRYGRLLDREGRLVSDDDPERFGKALHLKDIHLEKGMQCIDCHGSGDTHGDGKLYAQMRDVIEIRCIDCHGTPARRATLVTSGRTGSRNLTRVFTAFGSRWLERRGDKVIQHSKVTQGLSWEVPQVADAVDPASPRFNPLAARAMALRTDGSVGPVSDEARLAHKPQAMECVACHAAWNTGCYGCHLSVRVNVKTDELHMGKEPSRGYTDYFPQFLRADNPMLGVAGIREGHKISPFRPANPVFVSVTDRGRNVVVHEQPTISSPGFSGFAFTPNIPHTTRRKEARDCEDCHVSRTNDNNAWMAAVLGFGTNGANFMGDYVYVAAGTSGVWGIRVAEGYEPKPVIGSWLHSVAYPDDYRRFVARGHRLGEAHRAGSTSARAIVRRGEFLFVADGPGGLRVFDIAQIANKSAAQRINPAPFSPLGNRFQLPSRNATAVALATSASLDLERKSPPENLEQSIAPLFRYAFVTDAVEGLIVADINTFSDGNPTNNFLRRDATYNPDGALTGARNLTIAGNYAYIVSATTGLHVVDVSTPTAPRLVASVAAPAIVDARAVQVQFRYAFVVDREGLKVVDVTNPTRPRVTGARVPLRDARDLYLVRTHAYVAAGADGLAIVDIERPEAPGAPTFFTADGAIDDASGITVGATYAGQYAYVADGKNGLRVVRLIDTSTPGYLGWAPGPTPALIASLPLSGPALRVAEGYKRDRANDESGNQIGVASRLGSRPFNAADLARVLTRDGELIRVENSVPRLPR